MLRYKQKYSTPWHADTSNNVGGQVSCNKLQTEKVAVPASAKWQLHLSWNFIKKPHMYTICLIHTNTHLHAQRSVLSHWANPKCYSEGDKKVHNTSSCSLTICPPTLTWPAVYYYSMCVCVWCVCVHVCTSHSIQTLYKNGKSEKIEVELNHSMLRKLIIWPLLKALTVNRKCLLFLLGRATLHL